MTKPRLLLAIAALSLVHTVHSWGTTLSHNSAVIQSAADEIGGMMNGVSQSFLLGNTLQEMMEDFASTKGLDTKPVYDKTGLEGSDGSDVGTTTADEFYSFIASAEITDEETGDAKPVNENQLKQIMKMLDATGVVYVFDDYGSSACGMNFTEVGLLDTEMKILYTLYTIPGGPC